MKFKKAAVTASCFSLLLASAMTVQASPKGTIYLTFDDGPVNATIPVLDVLNEAGIKATFYFNAWHLDGIGDENEDRALEALKYALDTGHMVANHSYNHMVHNCVEEFGPNSAAECNATGDHQINSYQDPVFDASMFSKNIDVNKSYIPTIDSYPNYKKHFARLPYTNAWRASRELQSHGLCATSDDLKPWEPGYVCDTDNPSNSVKSSIQLADILSEQNYLMHGWDLDWAPENWGVAEPANTLTDAATFLQYVENTINTCAPINIEPINSKSHGHPCDSSLRQDKVIALTHDWLFEDGHRGMGSKNLPKLAEFIRLAKEAGYVFDTIDNYAPSWAVGTAYAESEHVTYQGVVYKAARAHTAQADWAPSSTSTLWLNAMPTTLWTVNVDYKVGDEVAYKGERYVVDVAHVSQADWTPDVQNSLFTLLVE